VRINEQLIFMTMLTELAKLNTDEQTFKVIFLVTETK